MGGSLGAGRRDVGGEQEAFSGALVGGRDGAEARESFLRPEPRRGLVGTDESGVLLPDQRGDDPVGHAGRDDEPEPKAKPEARAERRRDALAGSGPLGLKGDLDRG